MSSNLLLIILSIPAIGCAITAVISYFLYLKARLTDRGHPDEPRLSELQIRALDKKEERYLSIHSTSLLIFFLLGVAILATFSYRAD